MLSNLEQVFHWRYMADVTHIGYLKEHYKRTSPNPGERICFNVWNTYVVIIDYYNNSSY